MALLELQEVTKRFGGLVAVDRVSTRVEKGEIIGLLGPNGAGKTTLFNCIAGYYKPTSGQIRFNGRDIAGRAPEVVCTMGVARTHQVTRTFESMTVLDNVIVGTLKRVPSVSRARREALEILAFTHLAAKLDAVGTDLTVADRKRLEIARALGTRPQLLMLDEAMAGLNPNERADAVDLIRRIRATGITIMLIEHVMDVVMPVSDRVVVLDYGKKIAEDIPSKVAQDDEVIKAYLGEKYHARRQ